MPPRVLIWGGAGAHPASRSVLGTQPGRVGVGGSPGEARGPASLEVGLMSYPPVWGAHLGGTSHASWMWTCTLAQASESHAHAESPPAEAPQSPRTAAESCSWLSLLTFSPVTGGRPRAWVTEALPEPGRALNAVDTFLMHVPRGQDPISQIQTMGTLGSQALPSGGQDRTSRWHRSAPPQAYYPALSTLTWLPGVPPSCDFPRTRQFTASSLLTPLATPPSDARPFGGFDCPVCVRGRHKWPLQWVPRRTEHVEDT